MRSQGVFSFITFLVCFFAISLGAFGQKVNFGVIAGAGLAEDFRPLPPALLPFYSNPNSDTFIVGPVLEVTLTRHLSVEVDALRRSVKYTRAIPLADGSSTISFSSTGPTWQFPLLLKYTFRAGVMNPFVELGPSFLPSQSRQHGITAGAGAEMNLGSMKVAPAVRYNRWADNHARPAILDQIEFLVGVGQSTGSAWASAFGHRLSLGALAGMGLSDTFRTHTDYVQGTPSFVSLSESKQTIVGLTLEFEPLTNLFLEVDGLYRPLHVTGENISIPAEGVRTNEGFTVLTWEFPVLAKYKWRGRNLRPFVEVGPSFRTTGNPNAYDPSHYGITGGVGAEAHLGKLRVSPAVRYSHWQADRKQPGTIPNQVELVVGLSF